MMYLNVIPRSLLTPVLYEPPDGHREMNFNYGNRSLFSKIEAAQTSLRQALGQYALDIEIRFTPNNPHKGAVIVDRLELAVSFGDAKADVGIAYPSADDGMQGAICLRQQLRQIDICVRFRLYMTPTILEAIEARRAGGDANFYIKVFGAITGYESDAAEPSSPNHDIAWNGEVLLNATPGRVYRPQRHSAEVLLTIPQSKWIYLLNSAGFNNIILFEISAAGTEEFGVAFAHVKDAQTAFNQGRYADVVDRCRDALDSLIEKIQTPWAAATNKDSRENMSVEECFRLNWGAVRQITHATHHRNKLKSQFTRPMAQYVVGATCLALSLASKERDLFVQKDENTSK